MARWTASNWCTALMNNSMPTPWRRSASGDSVRQQDKDHRLNSKPSCTSPFIQGTTARNSLSEFGLSATFGELHERIKCVVDGRGDAQLFATPRNVSIQRIDFRALAAIQVLSGRRKCFRHLRCD